MSDLIRKAVDLAEGFEFMDSHGVGRIWHEWLAAHEWFPAIENCPEIVKDALAAQLVRQYYAAGSDRAVFYSDDPIETIKYIVDKAIVDSGVLEK